MLDSIEELWWGQWRVGIYLMRACVVRCGQKLIEIRGKTQFNHPLLIPLCSGGQVKQGLVQVRKMFEGRGLVFEIFNTMLGIGWKKARFLCLQITSLCIFLCKFWISNRTTGFFSFHFFLGVSCVVSQLWNLASILFESNNDNACLCRHHMSVHTASVCEETPDSTRKGNL